MVVSRSLGGWAPVESRTSVKYDLESVVQVGGAATLHSWTPSLGRRGAPACWGLAVPLGPEWGGLPELELPHRGACCRHAPALDAGDSFLLGSETLGELSSGPLSVFRSHGLSQGALTGYWGSCSLCFFFARKSNCMISKIPNHDCLGSFTLWLQT